MGISSELLAQTQNTNRWRIGCGILVLSLFLAWGGGLSQGLAQDRDRNARQEARTWKTVSELSAEELARIDLRTETPRDATIPYIPAEPYPFSPPYTAEEMGFLSSEFAHMPRWNCALVEDYGSITTSGYLTTSRGIGLIQYREPEGLLGQITAKPGAVLTHNLLQPDRYPRL